MNINQMASPIFYLCSLRLLLNAERFEKPLRKFRNQWVIAVRIICAVCSNIKSAIQASGYYVITTWELIQRNHNRVMRLLSRYSHFEIVK